MSLPVEVALYLHLTTSAAVFALLGDRIQPSSVSEQTVRPCVAYSRLSSDHQNHMRAASGLVFVRIQLDIFADTFGSLNAVCEAIRNRLDGYRGTITSGPDSVWIQQIHLEGTRDEHIAPTDGSDRGVYRRLMDLRISAAETVPTLTA